MPEAQERRGTTASGSRRGRPQHLKKGGLRRKQPRRHLDLGLRTSRSVRKLLGSSHPACGILFRDPQHTNPGPREVLVLTCVQLESKGVCVCVQCVSSLSCGLTDGILEGASPEDHVAARPAPSASVQHRMLSSSVSFLQCSQRTMETVERGMSKKSHLLPGQMSLPLRCHCETVLASVANHSFPGAFRQSSPIRPRAAAVQWAVPESECASKR